MSFRRALSTAAALSLVAVAVPLTAAPAQAVLCGWLLQPGCAAPTTEIVKSVGTPTEIDPNPYKITANRTASFTFKVKEEPTNVVFQCKVEKRVGGSFLPSQYAPCTSPKTYPNLSDGLYKFSVQSIQNPDDPLGLKLALPVPGTVETYVWEVDGPDSDPGAAGLPTVALAERPAFWLTDNWFSFDLVSNEPTSRFICVYDNKPVPEQVCGNGQWNQFGNGPGDHSIKVWAVDLDGNVSAAPAVAEFSIPVSAEYLTERRGGWRQRTGNKHMRHLYIVTTNKGAQIKHGFRGKKRKIVLLVGKGPGYGSVKITINNKVVKRINLSASEEVGKVLIPIKSFKKKQKPSMLKIIVTSSGKPVVIEALGFSKR